MGRTTLLYGEDKYYFNLVQKEKLPWIIQPFVNFHSIIPTID